MNPSTRPDVNHVSYSGNNITVEPTDLSNTPGEQYSDVLKFSRCKDTVALDLRVPQGMEDAVDITQSTDVYLHGVFGTKDSTHGAQVITIKGCQRINISGRIKTDSTKSGAHVEVGNWLDQNYSMCKDIHIDLARDNGPVFVAVGWAVPFSTKLGSHCKYLFWHSVKLKAYWVCKWAIRMALRLPKGQKGPSWF